VSRRVLLVTDAYAPTIGGAERAVELTALGLRSRGYTVAVAAPWHPGVPARQTRDGIEVHRVRDLTSRVPWISSNPYRHVPPPWPDPEAVLRFRRLIAEFGPDLVESYGWLTYSCAAALRRTSIPMVVSMRDYGNFCAVRTLLHRRRDQCSGPRLAKCLGCAVQHYGAPKGVAAVAGVLGGRGRLARSLAGIHFNSGFMRDVAWRHMLDGRTRLSRGSPEEVVVPPFLAPTEEPAPDPAILDRLPADPYILFVGALRVMKGVPDLLEAYGRIPDAPPLVLAGTREIDTPASFPPGVSFMESMPHEAVMAAWDRALFGVFPSRGPEPFGVVVLEAMARGRAVIGTVPSGHTEMIAEGVNGLLVRSGDVDALTAAMRKLIDDAALRERLGAAGREAAAAFTAERWVPRLVDLFETVAGGAR
jgi:glycosyltransferase involved in cell wall biosynthesis